MVERASPRLGVRVLFPSMMLIVCTNQASDPTRPEFPYLLRLKLDKIKDLDSSEGQCWGVGGKTAG